jgi:hypothetical protein
VNACTNRVKTVKGRSIPVCSISVQWKAMSGNVRRELRILIRPCHAFTLRLFPGKKVSVSSKRPAFPRYVLPEIKAR